MAVKTLSVWDGVPDADTLKATLAKARDPDAPLYLRQEALSYLTGATKVLRKIEKRQALAEYLARQIQSIKSKLYYATEMANADHQ